MRKRDEIEHPGPKPILRNNDFRLHTRSGPMSFSRGLPFIPLPVPYRPRLPSRGPVV